MKAEIIPYPSMRPIFIHTFLLLLMTAKIICQPKNKNISGKEYSELTLQAKANPKTNPENRIFAIGSCDLPFSLGKARKRLNKISELAKVSVVKK